MTEARVINMWLVNYNDYKFLQGNNYGFDLEYNNEAVVEEYIWKMCVGW